MRYTDLRYTPIWAYGILGCKVSLRSTQSNSKEGQFFNQVPNRTHYIAIFRRFGFGKIFILSEVYNV
jgi:hypothetical protein